MFKRIVLALTFVAAFGAAGLGINRSANAWHDCHRDYYGYANYVPASYYGYGYGPRTAFYPSYPGYYPVVYRSSYGHGHRHHHHHDHHSHGGVRVSFGF